MKHWMRRHWWWPFLVPISLSAGLLIYACWLELTEAGIR